MPIKLVADSRDEFAEDVRDSAREVDGKFEMDAAPVLAKRKELLGKNAGLKERITELEGERDEWKGKAKIPDGQKLVAEDVAELGEAAKAAEISKDELPTLKTRADELQGKLDEASRERTVETVAKGEGYNEKFVAMAKDKKLNFEIAKEKDGDADVEVRYVVENKDGQTTKTKVADFVKNDSFFSQFADTFTAQPAEDGVRFPIQKPIKDARGLTEFDLIRSEMKDKQKTAQPTDNNSIIAALNGIRPPAATT